MGREWLSTTVAELQREGLLLVEDGNHGENRPRPDEFVSSGVAFIRAADMDKGRVLFESASRINAVARKRITKGIGARGDILLSHKGTVGKVAIVGDDAPEFVCSPQTTFWRTLDMKALDRNYLYAFLRSAGFHKQLAARAGETDMAPYVSLTSQRGLLITLPPIGVQREIGRILRVFDDKIDLNRRMSETLEAIAQTLFRSWFVDFDPVRAKVERRNPRLPAHLAELFPASLEHSGLGMIPREWRAVRWGEVVTLEYGKSLRDYEGSDGEFPVYGTNGRIGSFTKALCEHPGIVIGRKGAYRGVHYSNQPFFVIDTAFYVKPKSPIELRWAYYELLRLDINSMDSGSAIPSTSREEFYNLPVVLPSLDVQRAFVQILSPFWERQQQCELESRTLAALRDTLLPKLISGELRVPDAERLVADVA